MDKIIERLIKEREPVNPKCRGEGFSAEEQALVLSERCTKIEPVEFYDESGKHTMSYTNELCRCTAYVSPDYWWNRGRCPLATHFRSADGHMEDKKRVGQQKQKKR